MKKTFIPQKTKAPDLPSLTTHLLPLSEFITGFSGSAGTAVIALDDNKAALATDGRYFNQASKQLDSNWELLKQGLEDVPTWQEWTADRAVGGKRVGVDPTVITVGEARRLGEKIKKVGRDVLLFADS